MNPWLARASLIGVAILFLASALAPVRPSPPSRHSIRAGAGDDVLFKAVIERVRRGQSYYDAMGEELSSRYYPTSSVFNWRTPVIFLLMAAIGLNAAWWLLGLLAAVLMVLSILDMEQQRDLLVMPAGVVALVGAFLVALAPTMLVHTEGWCGILVGLSVLAYARSRFLVGALLGLTALFVRELAAPYCFVAGTIALRGHRWRETSVWLAGGVAFVIFYGLHASEVQAHQVADHASIQYSWLQWGGLPFLLETIHQNNAVLLNRPRILTAVFVALVGSSLFAVQLSAHARWAAVAYGALFLAIGQPFNDYWGLVTSPTLAFCAAFGPLGMKMLWRVARSRASPAASDG